VATLATPVATDRDFQRGRSPAQRLVRESADHAVAGQALAAAAATPPVGRDDPAGEDGSIRLEALPDHGQAESVESGEGGQVRAADAGRRGSVGHVEVFQMASVRTSIFGRPRRLPMDRRASPIYTVIWDEPSWCHTCPQPVQR